MAIKNIHLSLSQQDKVYAMKFLNSNNLKKELKYDNELIEIEVSSNSKERINTETITEEITNLIINIMKDKLLKEYILKQYNDTYFNEKEKIYVYSLDLFKEQEPLIRDSIYNKVYNYILNNNYINIEGFVKFRMKEFMSYISNIGDIAVEEYIMKKDQDEFINVLKYFVEIQDEKIDLLRVHIMKDDSFILYDKNGKIIDNIDDEEIINMVIQENLNYEDFLISTLLTLCPGTIEILDTLNNNSSKEITETIKSIFGDRVTSIYQN
ncbi:putative sporulation protein YtxC [Romboutsia sp.]|uniref:putative sporulation protein YtxC n=1 Tax=Romboutsia sp. TaxID=1965302 RepID=UPI002B9771C4|nr:putative sporulation protein YtxC [Romboutsia sp.]HSQ88953.1 putative sporulation protein YtxC [Romboutsia sp.]